MKKLFAFIKTKDNTEKTTSQNKKSSSKENKNTSAPVTSEQPRELFSGDYHDIGYC